MNILKYYKLTESEKALLIKKMLDDNWKIQTLQMDNFNRWGVNVSESTWEFLEKNGVYIPIKDLWGEQK